MTMMPEERVYVIPLRKAKRARRNRRAARAVKIVREYLQRHMKTEEVKLTDELNRKLWERGAKHTPSRVRVRAVPKEDGSVEAILAEGKITRDEVEAAERKPEEEKKPEKPEEKPKAEEKAPEKPEEKPKPEKKAEKPPKEKKPKKEKPKEEPAEEKKEEKK